MPGLSIHRVDRPLSVADSTLDPSTVEVAPVVVLQPLLLDIGALAALLARSVPSLHRDDAAGRLPAAVRIGGSKRWRYADITAWVELGCPSRADFEAVRRNRK
jgi:predicted DNA-binding transcriptional regulator AlpA